ncbi:MAG: T9SS type A sorting domain-containing protein [candidate division WOR-3 bacterium]|nr:MAG: T9SS type A sorting domain-containing protein [candidate division WOR-3 bacterium]
MYLFCKKVVLIKVGAAFILFTFSFSHSFAQGPDTLWTKRYGTEDYDIGYDMQPTSGSGYIIVGQTGVFGALSGPYLYFIKIDGEHGDSLWAKVYGTDEKAAIGYSVQETSDGGFIVAGFKEFSATGNRDIYLLRTDSLGDTIWTMTYGGPYTETYEEVCRSVIQTFDKGYLMGGYTHFYSGSHLYLIKTDSLGDTVWTKTYGEPDLFASARSVKQTQDGGYIIAGNIGPIEYYWKGWLLKTDAYGDTLWTRMYGDDEWDTYLHEMQVTSDSGYIIAGEAHYAYYDRRTYLVKTDKYGTVLWSRKYSASFDPLVDILGQSVQETPDGGFVVVGMRFYPYNNFDIYVIRTDSLGITLWTQNYGDLEDQEIGYSIQVTAEGNYVIAGGKDSLQIYDYDVFVMKTQPDVAVEEKTDIVRNYKYVSTIFSGPLQLPEGREYKVFDITGRVMEPDRLPPGIYFIEIDGVVTHKVVKVR